MKKNKAPYIVIAIICVFLALPGSFYHSRMALVCTCRLYFFQVAFLIGIWELIQVVNKKLEKFYSFEESPVTRISLQVLVSILIFLPVVFLTVHLCGLTCLLCRQTGS
jgi:uncharacterized membrane protein